MENKERLEEASEWLVSMYELLSLKTEVEDIEFFQKRIDLFNWMIEQINRLYGGEHFKGYKEMYEYNERINNDLLEQIDVTQRRNERLEKQNKRYREELENIQDIQENSREKPDYEVLEIVRKELESESND